MYWSRVPRDIQREILLRLPYDDILRLSQADETFEADQALSRGNEFDWITKDVDYWSKRANVDRRTFIDRARNHLSYHDTYLSLKYATMAKKLCKDARYAYGSRINYLHWACALRHVLKDTLQKPETQYEFARYVLDRAEDRAKVVSETLDNILIYHPKILHWVSSLGIRIVGRYVRGHVVLSTYEFGGMYAVKCLEPIVEIYWGDVVFYGYRHLDLMRYSVERKKVGGEILFHAYTNALRDGISDVVAYLKPHVGA